MKKHQMLFFALALSFSCGMLTTLPATALDETVNSEITVTDNEDPSTSEIQETYSETDETASPTADNTVAPISEDCDQASDEDCEPTPERYDPELENALDEGLANEPEVICATGDEPGCETESETAMWPLYVSLGTLAATIILVIIINFLGRKKR